MSYRIETRWGGSEDAPTASRMEEILDELDVADLEHPDTWLTHESGWTLAAYEGGLLVWDNLETDESPRHLDDVSRSRVLELWLCLSRGEIDMVEREAWLPGHGIPPRTEAERRASEQVAEQTDRATYDALGAERPGTRCATPECPRGTVVASAYCRPHHFEQVRHRPCPFDH